MKKYLYHFIILTFITALPFAGHTQTANLRAPSDVKEPVTHKELLIPNAFSPNNDGQNDLFKICNITNEKLIDFKIFNRWGTILFRTTDPRQGWDGMNKGQEQPVGVYGYMIRIGYADGYVETYKGTVTLIR